jgi:8-oxo-dGTP diphosphatase
MNTPNERFKVVAAVHFILLKDGKTLLGKRQNTGWADGKFHLIGGHIEKGELALTALMREAKEEVGIQIDLNQTRLAHVRSILQSDHTRLHLYFVITAWTGEIVNKETELCSELEWFDLQQLPQDITEDAVDTLKNISQNNYYSESNLDV